MHRLLALEGEVLERCELRPEDVPTGTNPFERVAELLLVATDGQDLVQARVLTAALDFGQVLERARRADEADLELLGELVGLAETQAELVRARPLEVVRA